MTPRDIYNKARYLKEELTNEDFQDLLTDETGTYAYLYAKYVVGERVKNESVDTLIRNSEHADEYNKLPRRKFTFDNAAETTYNKIVNEDSDGGKQTQDGSTSLRAALSRRQPIAKKLMEFLDDAIPAWKHPSHMKKDDYTSIDNDTESVIIAAIEFLNRNADSHHARHLGKKISKLKSARDLPRILYNCTPYLARV